MLMTVPAAADPEIAAAVFAGHVSRLERSEQARDAGWQFSWLDPLHVIVELTARQPGGGRERYYVKLGGEFYDLHPPTTSFVCPPKAADEASDAGHSWAAAAAGSRWLPKVEGMPWLAIHAGYGFPDGQARQLVCCSMTYEYYITNHAPTPGQVWQQGRHTIAATLNRLQEALTSQYYQGPAGALDT